MKAELHIPQAAWQRTQAWVLAGLMIACGFLHVQVPILGVSASFLTTVSSFVLPVALLLTEVIANGPLCTKPFWGLETRLLGAFTLFALMSVLWGGLPLKYAQNALVLVGISAGMAVARSYHVRSGQGYDFLKQVIPLVAIPMLLLEVLALVLRQPHIEKVIHERVFAIAILLPMAWWAARWRTLRHAPSLVALVGAWLLVGLSLSRMGFALATGIFWLALVPWQKQWCIKNWLLASMIILVCALIVIALLVPDLGLRLSGREHEDDPIGYTTMGRSVVWQYLWENWHGYLIGHGLGQSPAVIEPLYHWMDHPLNEYIRFAYDLGVVGLLLWLGVLASWLKAPLTLVRSSHASAQDRVLGTACLLAVGTFAILCMTDNGVMYIFVSLPLTIVLGICQGQAVRLRSSLPTAVSHATVS